MSVFWCPFCRSMKLIKGRKKLPFGDDGEVLCFVGSPKNAKMTHMSFSLGRPLDIDYETRIYLSGSYRCSDCSVDAIGEAINISVKQKQPMIFVPCGDIVCNY